MTQAEQPRATYYVRKAEPGNPFGNSWVDAPEAVPPCRFRLKADSELEVSQVVILADGTSQYDTANVEIDIYGQEG